MSADIIWNIQNLNSLFSRKTYLQEIQTMKKIKYPFKILKVIKITKRNTINLIQNNYILKNLNKKDALKEKVAIKLLTLILEPNFFIPAYSYKNNIIMQKIDMDLFTFIRMRAKQNNILTIDEIEIIFSQICRSIYILFNKYSCTYLDIKAEKWDWSKL